jgi:hypothetical protein
MRIVRWTAVTLATGVLFAPNAVAAKRQSNKQKAVQAVKGEIGRKYPLLDSTSSLVNVRNTHESITCKAASKTRFTCNWSATNELEEHAEGSARVVVYNKGAKATLYGYQCTHPYTPCRSK